MAFGSLFQWALVRLFNGLVRLAEQFPRAASPKDDDEDEGLELGTRHGSVVQIW